METSLYHYKAVVRSVYDGDTCTVDIDLGLGTWVHGEKLRLYRINAPEVRGVEREAGLRSRDFLRGQIDDREVYIQTIKDKKVIGSMGSVAASGGYYIAAATNKIVANPGTITGSIGVIMESHLLEAEAKICHKKCLDRIEENGRTIKIRHRRPVIYYDEHSED